MNYNFQKQFVAAVKSGAKRCTIRAKRKDGKLPKVGETLRLTSGARTKHYKVLLMVECKGVSRVRISDKGVTFRGDFMGARWSEHVARVDGFKDFAEMAAWFSKTHGLPFAGNLIEW